jgi:hypothetical protein
MSDQEDEESDQEDEGLSKDEAEDLTKQISTLSV